MCQPRQLKSEVPGQVNPFPVIYSSLHTYLMLGVALAVPKTRQLLLRREEGERMGILSVALGGRWGLHPAEAWRSEPCPARVAWHLSWSEAECVVEIAQLTDATLGFGERGKSPLASQRA